MSEILQYLRDKNINLLKCEELENSLFLSLKVIANPGSKKEGISLGPEGSLKVSIKERPVEGKANEAIIKYLSKKLGPPKSQIQILRGQKSKIKTIEIRYSFTKLKDAAYYLQMWKKEL